jgi:hypothetical protein
LAPIILLMPQMIAADAVSVATVLCESCTTTALEDFTFNIFG